MKKRCGYILTLNPQSERALFSKNILENIGFDVTFIQPIPNADKVISNKISMQYIYSLISNSENEYSYVFEDDINMLEEIKIDEIIEYEKISDMFFYLGICEYNVNAKNTYNVNAKNTYNVNAKNTGIKIRNKDVYSKSGFCKGLHAIGLSKKGSIELLKFSKESNERYMDVILEKFTKLYPANVCRYDLESYISGHRGILFQDRKKFPSMM